MLVVISLETFDRRPNRLDPPEAEMTRTGSTIRRTLTMFLAVGAGVLALSAPSWSATSETQQGAQVVSEVQSGRLSGSRLSSEQYTRVGQYLMSRALGSTERYEAMDSLMDRMMGQSVSDQMYLYMGERYLGKSVSPNANYRSYYGWMASMMSRYGGYYAGMMGGYLMAAYRSVAGGGAAPYGGMMGGYAGGNGTSSNPGGVHHSMMGSYAGAGGSSSSGWSTGAIVAVAVLGAVVIGGALAFAWSRLRRRGKGPGPASPATR
jgi:hypothetical protein